MLQRDRQTDRQTDREGQIQIKNIETMREGDKKRKRDKQKDTITERDGQIDKQIYGYR